MWEANLKRGDFFHQCLQVRRSRVRLERQRAGMLLGRGSSRRRGGRRKEGLDVLDAADFAISSAHSLGGKLTWPGVQ